MRTGTPHIKTGVDTAHHSESGGDTEHENVTRYSFLGWDTAHSNQCSGGIGKLFSFRGNTAHIFILRLGYCTSDYNGDTADKHMFRCSK